MIERWTAGDAGRNMPEEILVELGPIVRRHPWWRARARLTLALLADLGLDPPARVLDVGCGWGVTMEALEARGYRASGMDISRRSLEILDRPARHLIEADISRELPGPCVAAHDAVLALDVIEHLDDDAAAVGRLATLTSPGGVVVISVPALPWLYGEFDAVQGHRRRYLPDDIHRAVSGSGLVLERTFWWGQWLVSAIGRQRSAERGLPGESASEVYRRYLRVPPWPLSAIARCAFAIEQGPALHGHLTTGTSLFAVARRPHAGVPRSRDASHSSSPATQTA